MMKGKKEMYLFCRRRNCGGRDARTVLRHFSNRTSFYATTVLYSNVFFSFKSRRSAGAERIGIESNVRYVLCEQTIAGSLSRIQLIVAEE